MIPAIAERYGGPSTVCLSTCRALRKRGHAVLIATSDADGEGRLSVPTDVMSSRDGLPAIFFRRRASEAFKWTPELARWLDSHVADFDIVDVHAVFSHASIAAGGACRRRGVPYVVRPHGALDPWSVARKRWQKQALLACGGRALLQRAAAVLYTTPEEQRLAESTLGRMADGRVVSLGIDDEWFGAPTTEAPASPYVLVLSRLHEKKNLMALIDAFHRVAALDTLAGWRLIIAGTGEAAYVSQLQQRASTGPGAGRIEFPGWVAGEQKRALVRGASLFAIPSHQENFGLALIEALASGVPALLTPGVNLAAEVEGMGAGWISNTASDALAESLVSATGDPAGRAARGRQARVYAQRFRWEKAIDPLLEVYAEMADGRRPMGMTA